MFDVVGTLVEPWPTVPVAYQRAARRQGIECSAEDLRGRFAAAWQRQEAIDAAATPPYATSRTREVQRWRGIVHEVFAAEAPDGVREAVFADLWGHFADPGSWRSLEQGQRLVQAALDAGCGVALVIEGQVTPIDDVGGTLFDEQRTFDEAVGERARRQDETSWHSDVVVAIARIAQRWPQAAVHLCGGNAKRLSPTQLKETSSTITIERGEPALKGGFMMLTGLSA